MTVATDTPTHLLTLADPAWGADDIRRVLRKAAAIKADPDAYRRALAGRTLLMLFEKPSLRTRVSFETGMTQLGGHAIFYSIADSPLGQKETFGDTGQVLSRYVDIVMARLFRHGDLEELAAHSTVPVINALTNFSHPCQILADLLTIEEHKSELAGRTLCYLGDACNNVTHSLLYGCTKLGMSVHVGCPDDPGFRPHERVTDKAREYASATGCDVLVTDDPAKALAGADVVYTDSWMSYHIQPAEAADRIRTLTPYQVTAERMAQAAPDAIFMNCLPAKRGEEQTAEVIDGPASVVFDEAENRLHAQKALMIDLVSQP